MDLCFIKLVSLVSDDLGGMYLLGAVTVIVLLGAEFLFGLLDGAWMVWLCLTASFYLVQCCGWLFRGFGFAWCCPRLPAWMARLWSSRFAQDGSSLELGGLVRNVIF